MFSLIDGTGVGLSEVGTCQNYSNQQLQSWPKVVGTLELYHISPIPPNQCWVMSHFFHQKGNKSPDYQH